MFFANTSSSRIKVRNLCGVCQLIRGKARFRAIGLWGVKRKKVQVCVYFKNMLIFFPRNRSIRIIISGYLYFLLICCKDVNISSIYAERIYAYFVIICKKVICILSDYADKLSSRPISSFRIQNQKYYRSLVIYRLE